MMVNKSGLAGTTPEQVVVVGLNLLGGLKKTDFIYIL